MENNMEFRTKNNTFSQEKPLIIAEIGTSHNGDMARAKLLVDAAKDAGATAVKFQIIYADEILHPNTGFVKLPTGNIPLFSASPFGMKSAKELAGLNPDFIKIASPELNFVQLLEYCADFNMPMIVSTGVSKLRDIEKAVDCISAKNPDLPLALLHCVTAYPAPESSYNISLVENLRKIFNLPVGLSDHSMDAVLVPALSLAFGGFIVEKHICLSRKEKGLDDPVALEPQQFKKMCDAIKKYSKSSKEEIIQDLIKQNYSEKTIKDVIGNGKKELSFAEKQNYGRTNRSIHYTKDLSKGTIITKNDLAILRTEKILSVGASPDKLNSFIGAKLKRSVESGH